MKLLKISPGGTKLNQDHNLGPEIASYPTRNRTYQRVVGTTLGTSIILAALSYFTLGLYELVSAVRLHGRAMVLPHAPSLILMLAFLPVGVVILLITAANWDNHITLYERGLLLQRWLRQRVWTWETTTRLDTHITHIKFGGSIIDIRVRFILGNPQETLVIRNQYEDMAEVIQKVRAILLPRLVNWAISRFDHNQAVNFSPSLSATRQGFVINGDRYAWRQIEAPIVKNHKLILRKAQDHEKVFQGRVKQISNLDLLIFLVNNPPDSRAQSSSR